MAIRIVRLGSPRAPDEGLRLGTVRRPPRGVKKSEHATGNFYDVWLPNLAPSEELLKTFLGIADDRAWRTFARRYQAEMKSSDTTHLLELLATLSHTTQFSVGCYCADESRCHRSLLRELLIKHGAQVVAPGADI